MSETPFEKQVFTGQRDINDKIEKIEKQKIDTSDMSIDL